MGEKKKEKVARLTINGVREGLLVRVDEWLWEPYLQTDKNKKLSVICFGAAVAQYCGHSFLFWEWESRQARPHTHTS